MPHIQACSMASKIQKIPFLRASNSKFIIFSQSSPCIKYRAIKYPPVSIEFGIECPPVSQTLLIQGDNLSRSSVYRAILDTGGSYCTICALCNVTKEASKHLLAVVAKKRGTSTIYFFGHSSEYKRLQFNRRGCVLLPSDCFTVRMVCMDVMLYAHYKWKLSFVEFFHMGEPSQRWSSTWAGKWGLQGDSETAEEVQMQTFGCRRKLRHMCTNHLCEVLPYVHMD